MLAALAAMSHTVSPAARGILRLLARTAPQMRSDAAAIAAAAGLDERAARTLLGELSAEGLLRELDGSHTVPHLVRQWAHGAGPSGKVSRPFSPRRASSPPAMTPASPTGPDHR